MLLVGKPEGKQPRGRPTLRLVDYINMDVGEMGCDDKDWIDLTQDRTKWRALVEAVVNLRFCKMLDNS
jgi:hypothetical protein